MLNAKKNKAADGAPARFVGSISGWPTGIVYFMNGKKTIMAARPKMLVKMTDAMMYSIVLLL